VAALQGHADKMTACAMTRLYLLLVEDDYSRFLVGHALCEGERAQLVHEAVEHTIGRHDTHMRGDSQVTRDSRRCPCSPSASASWASEHVDHSRLPGSAEACGPVAV
jgi:hypothetical protein